MNLHELKTYCLSKKGTQETFPFDTETLVFKVGSKMFALTNINEKPMTLNLKCDPDFADDLRKEYPSITPGYHMNKRHWNTILIDGTLPDDLIKHLIDLSYNLVFKNLTKKEKDQLNET
jgi:predicted DNA-binding protein (MmcQ/YjbR family)